MNKHALQEAPKTMTHCFATCFQSGW